MFKLPLNIFYSNGKNNRNIITDHLAFITVIKIYTLYLEYKKIISVSWMEKIVSKMYNLEIKKKHGKVPVLITWHITDNKN